ncbi:MAG: tetratricopeptide repeat protein [Flavobacteriia bacterium]|nr:tetratricopeptide repeat protein [Flavobacteriia bacterium]
MKKIFILFFAIVWINNLNANNNIIQADSTLKLFFRSKNKIIRIKKLNDELEHCWRIGLYERGLILADYTIHFASEYHNEIELAKAHLNKGIIYDFIGEYAKSLHHYFEALKIQNNEKDQLGLSQTYNNIGLIYSNQGDFQKAEYYHVKSLKICRSIKNESGISIAINNLGIVYMNQHKYDLALKSYLFSVNYDKKSKNEIGMADSYSNVGIIYMKMKKFQESEKYFLMAIRIRKKLKDINGIGNSYNNLGSLYVKKEKYDLAKNNFYKAIGIGKKIGAKILLEYAYENLSDIGEKTDDYKSAFMCYQKYNAYHDSIINEDVLKSQTKDELQYIFDLKTAKELHKHNAMQMTKENKIQRQKFIIISSITLIIITFSLTFILIRKYRFEKNQNLIIEEQKALVELKNQEILSSINYAKRIQTAILPPEKLVKNYLINSFILYIPKDIVAGDFYWIEPRGESIIFAVADCTGHGVPGAMMSVVCHNALNRSVREFGLTVPGEILDQTRKIIIEEFEKSEDDVYDGMDISLCNLNFSTNKLQWSGANNPLWYIKKDTSEILEIKANKQPIGKYDHYNQFVTHEIQLQTGDSVYLFTDGLADQFGGPLNKKFKTKKMKELILSLGKTPMQEQRIKFLNAFENWKNEHDQIDDVCIIGLQI